MRRVLSLLLLGFFTAILSGCPGTPVVAPDLETRLVSEVSQIVDANSFPGMTAAIALPDGAVVAVAVGLADRELGTAMTPQSRVLAASIGKTFVAATILAFEQEELLSLDDPISKWLSKRVWFERLPNYQTTTIRHLLTHTSGLPDHVHDEAFAKALALAWQADESIAPETLVGFILDQAPLFEAGNGWSYTDTGYILLGLIAEQVTGQPYYELIKERFLTPLALTQTSPSNQRELIGLAAGYMAPDNAFALPPKTTDEHGVMVWNPGVEWTGGGLVSTSRDLAVWGKALFEGRAFDGDYREALLRSTAISPTDSTQGYGAGVTIQHEGTFGPAYGHRGWIPGYSSSLRYYPRMGVAIAFQINTDIGIIDVDAPMISMFEMQLATAVFGQE